MFRFYAMLFKNDQSCYDFPVLFVLIFLTHSTSLLFLFLNYFFQEYVWKKNLKQQQQEEESKTIPKKKNGYNTVHKTE